MAEQQLPSKLNLMLVTRERKILDLEVDEVVLPGVNGAFGVLPGHTPLLAELTIGEAWHRIGDKVSRGVLSWGFAEVQPDRVIVIAEGAIRTEEMSIEAVEAWKREQEQKRTDLSSHDTGFVRAEAQIGGSLAGLTTH